MCDLAYAASAMQGLRKSMEDAHVITELAGVEHHSLIGVFDGHGGDFTAHFTKDHLVELLLQQPSWIRYVSGLKVNMALPALIGNALCEAFVAVDELLCKRTLGNTTPTSEFVRVKRLTTDTSRGEVGSGCTAVVTVVTPTYVVCANAGDSRSIVCSDVGSSFALSTDHKPTCADEKARIIAAGGFVCEGGRIDGMLAVSRAIGDFEFKTNNQISQLEQKVSCLPEIVIRERQPNDSLLVLACDGVWDVMDNGQCAEALFHFANKSDNALVTACEELLDKCLALGSRDNMSIVVANLQSNESR